jgi:hypothetical protein
MKILPKLIAAAVAGFTCAAPTLAHAETPGTHDGFYFRFALGPGYAADAYTTKFAGRSQDGSIRGIGVASELMIGGTVAPGLALGGGLQSDAFPKPTVKVGDLSAEGSGTLQLATLGPFVDYYLNPKGGFHIQGMLGLAVLSARDREGNSSKRNPSGSIASVGVGQDWFVSDAWSVGILGRLQVATTKYSENGVEETHTTVVPAVLASFTYH